MLINVNKCEKSNILKYLQISNHANISRIFDKTWPVPCSGHKLRFLDIQVQQIDSTARFSEQRYFGGNIEGMFGNQNFSQCFFPLQVDEL